ncbi:MAG: hypothetical protein HRU21_12580 [Pseudomonadales bacterium]|nr:hypothetical protein [Pseudomonadales bacterium]
MLLLFLNGLLKGESTMVKSFFSFSLLLLCIFYTALGSTQEDTQLEIYAMNDEEYDRLSESFYRESASVPESRVMDEFLRRFDGKYKSLFERDDVLLIHAHSAEWIDELRRIINTTNAYNYLKLMKFTELSQSDFTVDVLQDYAETYRVLDREHEQRIMEHHAKLLSRISANGAATIKEICELHLRPILNARALSKGSKPVFDWDGFIDSYPRIMAKQAYIESQRVKRQGPPRELVWKKEVIPLDGSDASVVSMSLSPKGNEK